MGSITKPYNFAPNTTAVSSQVNSDFDTIYSEFNGNIENANIKAGAAISASKIAGTAATLAGTETLTNKTLTKPIVDGSVQGTASYTPSASGTATLDCSADNVHLVTMPAGNITLAVSNVSVGQFFYVRILQDSGGSRTVTWFTTIKWAGGSAPTLTTTANSADLFAFFCTSSGNYDGFVVGQGIA